MEEVKKFRDFSIKNIPANNDFIVGYEEESKKEIKVPVNSLTSRGTDGASVRLQYSSDGVSWHYPSQQNDIYMQQKVGTEPWSQSFKIAVKETREISILFTKKSMNGEISPVPFKWVNDILIQQVVLMSNTTNFEAEINGETYDKDSLRGVTVAAGTEIQVKSIGIQAGNTQGNFMIICTEV